MRDRRHLRRLRQGLRRGRPVVDGVADTWDAGALRGNFNQLRKLKRMYPNIKVIWSFGGWTWSGGFGQAAANPTAFANSCYNLVEDPRWADVFDGIDIDWEYPNACGLSCDTSGAAAFKNLMSGAAHPVRRQQPGHRGDHRRRHHRRQDRRGRLRRRGAVRSTGTTSMTYDYFGAFAAQGPTAPHSPLTSYAGIPIAGFYSDAAIQKLKSKGVPASKLLLGIGFYGRGWTGVTQSAPGRHRDRPGARHVRAGHRGLQGPQDQRARPRARSPAPRTRTAAATGGATTPRPPSAGR